MFNSAIYKNRITNDINAMLLVFVIILILGMTVFSGISTVGFNDISKYTGKNTVGMLIMILLITLVYSGIVIGNMNKFDYKYFYGSIPVKRSNIYLSEWAAVITFLFSACVSYDLCRCIELKSSAKEVFLQQIRSINEFLIVTLFITALWFISTLVKNIWLLYLSAIVGSAVCVGIVALIMFISGYLYVVRLFRKQIFRVAHIIADSAYFEVSSNVKTVNIVCNIIIYIIVILLIVLFLKLGIKNYKKYNFSSARIIPCVTYKKAMVGILVSVVTAVPITLLCYGWYKVCAKSIGLKAPNKKELAKLPEAYDGLWNLVFYGNKAIATAHLWKFEIGMVLLIALGIKIIIDVTKGFGQSFIELPWED